MKSSNISFVSAASLITMYSYREIEEKVHWSLATVVGGVVGAALLSPAAALDLGFHTLMLPPTCVYAVGKSIYKRKIDFVLPWQHLQRVRNSVAPLIMGSAYSLLHPYAGVFVSEPVDKHLARGILTSHMAAPCSPVASDYVAKAKLKSLYSSLKKDPANKCITERHIKLINDVKNFECNLQIMHGQEIIAGTAKVTELCLGKFLQFFSYSHLDIKEQIAIRVAAVCIPVFTLIDLTISLSLQAFFLTAGVVRLISGRGPLYTEMTTNPLLHVAMMVQTIFKALGNLLATPAWLISPELALATSRISGMLFMELQMQMLMLKVKLKMYFLEEGGMMAMPIVLHNGSSGDIISIPWETMHATYLIIQKKNGKFDLSWVNRPTITRSLGLEKEKTVEQIQALLRVRFPQLDLGHIAQFPINADEARLMKVDETIGIPDQTSPNNCVVSNLFGMLDALDIIVDKDQAKKNTDDRNRILKQSIQRDYNFYQYDVCMTNNESSFPLVEYGIFTSDPGCKAV